MTILYGIIIALSSALVLISVLFLNSRNKNAATLMEQRKTISRLKFEGIRVRITTHFFFNALSTISGLTTQTGIIEKNIKTLLILLRKSVDNIEQLIIPLYEELELVKGYIELQSLIVPDPFIISYEVQPGLNLNSSIPAMIIQIPVENAIKHGLLPLTGQKILRIKITNSSGRLNITIEDNGIGYLTSSKRTLGAGTGLKVLYQTLDILNEQKKQKIEFLIRDKESASTEPGGTIVEIKIPNNYSFTLS